jgi:copper resistance protein C
MRFRHGSAAALLALVGSIGAAAPIAAHSELVSSSPAAGSTVTPAPGFSIVLSFSEELKTGSKADVIGPAGTTVGTATTQSGDNTRLQWSPAAALPAGSYRIQWTSIATDGDVLRGTIPFTVVAATASSPPPTATPAPSPAPGNVSAAGIVAIIPVFVALLFVGLLALVLMRKRRPTPRP